MSHLYVRRTYKKRNIKEKEHNSFPKSNWKEPLSLRRRKNLASMLLCPDNPRTLEAEAGLWVQSQPGLQLEPEPLPHKQWRKVWRGERVEEGWREGRTGGRRDRWLVGVENQLQAECKCIPQWYEHQGRYLGQTNLIHGVQPLDHIVRMSEV